MRVFTFLCYRHTVCRLQDHMIMRAAVGYAVAFVAQWQDLENSLISSTQHDTPITIDSALDPTKPTYSTERPTLFRERHGWCPYSERVWLALESTNIAYDTVRIGE